MSKQYRVAKGFEFAYPADPESEALVKNAGGRSNLSDADRAKVKFKTVTEGQDCSDMPASSIPLYLDRGWIEEGDK